jgi:predicted Zn finger-like uncharacterized protein
MTMEVACPQCGAQYKFDASAVPAQGYDAQCTRCATVFFVAPEEPEPTPAADPQVSIACQHCGAVYQFPASAIPAQGYDAQCTRCQKVFFVAAGGAAEPPAELTAPAQTTAESPAAAAEPPAEPTAATQAPGVATVPVATEEPSTSPAASGGTAPLAELPEEPAQLTDPKPTAEPVPFAELSEEPTQLTDPKPAAEPTPTAEMSEEAAELAGPEPTAEPAPEAEISEQAAQLTDSKLTEESVPLHSSGAPQSALDEPTPEASDDHDMLALSEELGEPDAAPEGVSLEEEFGTIMRRKRTVRSVVAVAVAVVGGFALFTYSLMPRVFDLTVGRVLPIKLTIDPHAVPHVEKGLAHMLADTDTAYQEAVAAFDAALAIDDRYPAAVALSGLALVFRGSDLQAKGRAVRAVGEEALAELNAIEELPASKRPANSNRRLAELRERVSEASRESAELFEGGGEILRDGFARLRDGLKAYRDEPLVAEAAGIYYTTDSDSIPRASELLRHSLLLRYGSGGQLDLSAPPNGWLPYLQALVLASEHQGDGAARAAFAAALTAVPRFQRARYELARFEEQRGRRSEAERLSREILATVAGHDKAKQLLARLTEPPQTSTAPATATPTPAKVKKRKRKRR